MLPNWHKISLDNSVNLVTFSLSALSSPAFFNFSLSTLDNFLFPPKNKQNTSLYRI